MSTKRICIGTTLAPFNFNNQRVAIESWIKSGFDVLSCNSKEEIEILSREFSDLPIQFVEMENGIHINGKVLPSIYEILSHVKAAGYTDIGFCNSDIHMRYIGDNEYNFIRETSKDSILIVQRNEIDKFEDITVGNFRIHFDGIDTFFLNSNFIEIYKDTNLGVQNTWDLFLQILAKEKAIAVKRLINPVCFHIRHPQKWSFENERESCETIAKHLNYDLAGNEADYFLNKYYSMMYSSTQAVGFDCQIEFKGESSIPTSIIEEQCAKSVVDWIFEKLDISTLELVPYIIDERTDSFSNPCRYLLRMKEIAEKNGWIIRYSKKQGDIATLFLPVYYRKILDDDACVTKVVLPESIYIAPAGIRAREWVNRNQQLLKNIEIKAYIDNNKDGNDIRKISEIAVDEDSQCILISKYYEDEIKQQLLEYFDENQILSAGKIFSINESGYVNVLK